MSPSSRRAWIEIFWLLLELVVAFVALLAEGVDRNCVTPCLTVAAPTSPSSRRAWIEISASILHGTHAAVALLAEGVDRNSSNFASFTSR